MTDQSTDTCALIIYALCLAVVAAYLCYLSLWVVPGKVRSIAYSVSLAALFFCGWSLLVFGFLFCCFAVADRGRHTHVDNLLGDAGGVLSCLDCFGGVICIVAFVAGWLIHRMKVSN